MWDRGYVLSAFYRISCLTVGSASPTFSSKHDWAKQVIKYKNHPGVVKL